MSEIRDPIYGFIKPTEIELKIINTHIFQRLRRIKQLAMAYLVYPGANHTRFEHSIGVSHIASLMSEKLFEEKKENEEKIRIIRLAALLHDIGHGPFSHVSEELLNKYSTTNSQSKEKIHELITQNLINSDEELKKLLSEDDRQKIIGLLNGNQIEFSLMKNIISGPIDADKLDYLLRDSYFCGVKYGVFDLHRLLNTLTFYNEDSDKYIAVNYDGINSLEQFVLAKYYMTTQVYCHKVRLVADAMIIRGLELGIEKDEIEFLKKIYNYEDNDEYLKEYINYFDERVVYKIVFSNKKSYAKEIFKRLYDRKLYKRIFSEKLKNIYIRNEKFKEKLINITSKENEKLRKKIEKQISALLKCKKEYVIVNCFTIKSVREMSRNSEGKIIIIDRTGNKKNFEEESTVFSSIDESMKDVYFEVYAPVEYVDQKNEREEIKKFQKEILEILQEKKGG